MKRSFPPDAQARFSGNLRHYHRSGAPIQRSWDDWVEGTAAKSRGSKNLVKIAVAIASVLVLGAIAIGLAIELS